MTSSSFCYGLVFLIPIQVLKNLGVFSLKENFFRKEFCDKVDGSSTSCIFLVMIPTANWLRYPTVHGLRVFTVFPLQELRLDPS